MSPRDAGIESVARKSWVEEVGAVTREKEWTRRRKLTGARVWPGRWSWLRNAAVFSLEDR